MDRISCPKHKCKGCFACYNICTQRAIKMKEDELGNIYPELDSKKCIDCKLCEKICPELQEKKFLKPIKVYAMYNKNESIRKNSSSGAIATTLYEFFLRNNGIIYGASNLYEKNEFQFVRIDKKEDLYKVKGSKYVQCYIKDSYIKVKKDLNEGRKVLFIGTPCQVSGLKTYLMKEYENLFTSDILCHGTPNQQLLFDELKLHNIDKNDVGIISFRDNINYKFRVLNKKGEVLLKEEPVNIGYYKNFLSGHILRKNCYNCQYAQSERISDLSLGDFWELDKNIKICDDKYGISLVIVNSKKGEELINNIKSDIIFEERTLEEAKKGNDPLKFPCRKKIEYYIFNKSYKRVGYKRAMKKLDRFTNTKNMIKNILIVKVAIKLAKNVYRKVKNIFI